MKIISSRGSFGDDGKEGRLLTDELIKKLRKEAAKVHRFDGTKSRPSDVNVLLETGRIVAIPSQVFRGRVAFQFGKKKNKLIIVCAWCGKNMGEVESKIEGVSHGMCQECFDNVIKNELPKEK